MTDLHAKPIIPEKFWIVEKGGAKFATLRKSEDNHFVMSNELGIKVYETKEKLTLELQNFTSDTTEYTKKKIASNYALCKYGYFLYALIKINAYDEPMHQLIIIDINNDEIFGIFVFILSYIILALF